MWVAFVLGGITLDESGLRSPFPLVGNRPQTVLEATSSFHKTTALSFFPSRVPPLAG